MLCAGNDDEKLVSFSMLKESSLVLKAIMHLYEVHVYCAIIVVICAFNFNKVATVHHNTIRHADCQVLKLEQKFPMLQVFQPLPQHFKIPFFQKSRVGDDVRVDPHSKMNDRYKIPSELDITYQERIEGSKE